MPSPFPGVDPFIESQKWEDFHTTFIGVLRELLVPQVRPQYVVDVERYLYVTRTRRREVVVTVIELLSPWNKTPEAGVAEYLGKRANVLHSSANLP